MGEFLVGPDQKGDLSDNSSGDLEIRRPIVNEIFSSESSSDVDVDLLFTSSDSEEGSVGDTTMFVNRLSPSEVDLLDDFFAEDETVREFMDAVRRSEGVVEAARDMARLVRGLVARSFWETVATENTRALLETFDTMDADASTLRDTDFQNLVNMAIGFAQEDTERLGTRRPRKTGSFVAAIRSMDEIQFSNPDAVKVPAHPAVGFLLSAHVVFQGIVSDFLDVFVHGEEPNILSELHEVISKLDPSNADSLLLLYLIEEFKTESSSDDVLNTTLALAVWTALAGIEGSSSYGRRVASYPFIEDNDTREQIRQATGNYTTFSPNVSDTLPTFCGLDLLHPDAKGVWISLVTGPFIEP